MPKDGRNVPGNPSENVTRHTIPDSEVTRAAPGRPLSELFGILAYDGPPVTLEEMDRAVAEGACDC